MWQVPVLGEEGSHRRARRARGLASGTAGPALGSLAAGPGVHQASEGDGRWACSGEELLASKVER